MPIAVRAQSRSSGTPVYPYELDSIDAIPVYDTTIGGFSRLTVRLPPHCGSGAQTEKVVDTVDSRITCWQVEKAIGRTQVS